MGKTHAKVRVAFKPVIRNAGFLCKHLPGYLKNISQRAWYKFRWNWKGYKGMRAHTGNIHSAPLRKNYLHSRPLDESDCWHFHVQNSN